MHEVRERRLTAMLTVWLVIALHLYPCGVISGVFRKLVRAAVITTALAAGIGTASALARPR